VPSGEPAWTDRAPRPRALQFTLQQLQQFFEIMKCALPVVPHDLHDAVNLVFAGFAKDDPQHEDFEGWQGLCP